LPHSPLTHEDTQTLKSIGSLLDVLPDLPHIQELRTIVLALEDQVALKPDEIAPTFFLEQRPAATGTKYLSDLDKHIQKKNVLNISYLPFKNPDGSPSDAPIQRIIHPYFLKEYQRYWYLFGWSEDLQQVVNYALGRIQKIEIVRERSFIPSSFDPKSYFDDIIGVTKLENQVVEIYKIRVNDQIAPYWRSRPLHHSQQVLNDHVFQFKLRWNYEWQNCILYYGKNVEVLEPKWFRDSISQILNDAAKQYVHG
jgi:predicted DNA-binding transcriptional regulator YafY